MSEEDNWWQQDAEVPTGEAYLKTLDPAHAAQVKALAEGRMELPKGQSLRSGPGAQLLADVAQYDPSFDAANAPARIAARKAFTTGKQGQNISAFNTALGHLGTLAQRAEELDNTNFQLWNSLGNSALNATGDPRVSNFQIARTAVADELTRAFRGSGGNVHDIQSWEAAINSAQSPAQLRGAIGQAAELLGSRIQALQDQYNQSINSTTKEPLPLLNPHAEEALSRFQSKDYQDKGYSTVAPLLGDGNQPPDDGPLNPPSGGGGPTPAPSAPSGGVPSDGTLNGDLVAISDGKQRAAGDAGLDAVRKRVAGMVANGASGNDIRAYLQQNGVNPSSISGIDQLVEWRKRHPDYKGGYTVDIGQRNVEMSTGEKAFNAVADSPVGSFGIGASNAALFGTVPKIVAGVDATIGRLSGDNRSFGDLYDAGLTGTNFKVQQAGERHPIATVAGSTAGFIAGDAALSRIPGVAALASRLPGAVRPIVGDALYGTATGVGSSDSLADVPGNAIEGAALASGGGIVGRRLVRGAAALVSPMATGAVRRLTDAGVTLTPGQIAGASDTFVGRSVKGIEDRLAGFPVIGDIINGTRRGGTEDFNRAAINDALRPIGEAADDVGHAGIADAQRKVSAAYDDALSRMQAAPDAQLTSDLQAVSARTRTLSESHRQQFQQVMDTDLQPYLAGRQQLDGADLQAIKQGLDRRISNLRGQGSSPQDRDLADQFEGVRDAVLNLAARTNPDAASRFAQANEAYSLLSRVQGAAAKSKDGVFTPNQFRQAVTKRGYGTTTANVATNSARMQGLATDASTVLPSTVPDSGTAGRAALGVVADRLAAPGAGALLGGGAGYANGGSEGALLGGAAGAALLSRPGARGYQWLVAGSRGRPLNTLGDLLRRNASLGGAVGTPLLLQGLSTNGK